MLHGLVGFLVFLLVLVVIVYVLFVVVDIVVKWLGNPENVGRIAKLIIGLIALIGLLDRGLPLLGYGGIIS